MTGQFALTCVYCGMAWDCSSALECGRIIGRHEDVCPKIPLDAA